jgi:hypothetical protein
MRPDPIRMQQHTRQYACRASERVPALIAHPNSTHRYPEQRPDRQELLVRVAERRPQLEDGDQQQVDDQRPFPTVSVRGDSEDDRPDRSEEEGKGDGGGNVGRTLAELYGKTFGWSCRYKRLDMIVSLFSQRL